MFGHLLSHHLLLAVGTKDIVVQPEFGGEDAIELAPLQPSGDVIMAFWGRG